MVIKNREYLYINGYPYRIINGNHNTVLNVLKNDYLHSIVNVYDILLVDEYNDKYYHYEVVDGILKRIRSICLDESDRKFHKLFKDMF